MTKDNLRLYEHPEEKLSHYSKRTVDIEYRFDFTGSEWGELEGIANRTDFDLSTHAKASGQDLSYLDAETGERFVPYVIEPAAGVDRAMLRSCSTPTPRTRRPTPRASWRSAPCCASTRGWPRSRWRCCRCPATPTCRRKARDVAALLRQHWNADFDDASAIGRRYRRQDEIGTPFCVTVDFETLEDQAVTVRERDSMAPGAGRHRRPGRLPVGAPARLLGRSAR